MRDLFTSKRTSKKSKKPNASDQSSFPPHNGPPPTNTMAMQAANTANLLSAYNQTSHYNFPSTPSRHHSVKRSLTLQNNASGPGNSNSNPSRRPTRARSIDDIHSQYKYSRHPQSPVTARVPEELLSFNAYLERVSEGYPELGINMRDQTIEGAVEKLRDRYHATRDELQNVMDLLDEHQIDMSNLDKIKKENKDMRKQIEKLQKDVYQANSKTRALTEEKISLVTRHNKELDRLKSEHRSELNRKKTEYHNEMKSLKYWNETLQSDNKNIQRGIEIKIQKARDEEGYKWQQILSDVQNRNAEIAESARQLNDDLNNKIRIDASSHDARIATMITEQQIRETSMIASFDQERQKWQEHAKEREEQLNMSFNVQMSDKLGELEELKGALTKREHIDGLTDVELAEQFELLSNAVREVSRVRWDNTNQQYWPYNESVIDRAKNSRKLKQQIVQSSIWALLFDRIFFTPFQVFAEEGVAIHREWTHIYGQDSYSKEFPHWPHPSKKSETWRYQRVKNCVEALEQMGNVSGEMQRCKDGYGRSLSGTTREICKAIEQLCFVDDSKQRSIQNLVSQAAKFWLDVSSEHYRLLVIMPNSSGNLLQGTKPRYGQVQLVINPKLQRIGNAVGEALDKAETVGKWDGLSESYDLF